MVINPAMPHMVGSDDPRKVLKMIPDHGGLGEAALIRRAARRRKHGATATVRRAAPAFIGHLRRSSKSAATSSQLRARL
jgi:hypothetical protein